MPLETLPYASGPESRPDRTYAILLIVLALIYGSGILTSLFIPQIPATPPMDPSVKWAFRLSAAIGAFLVALIVATLIVRSVTRNNGCLIWTKAFNIFLLLVFPLGTAVGIYGLWKVDKAPPSAGRE